MQPALDPAIGMFLLERYPGWTRAGINSAWNCSIVWVEEHAPLLAHTAPAFVVAVLFRVQATCEQDEQRKAAFLFSAVETLAPHTHS